MMHFRKSKSINEVDNIYRNEYLDTSQRCIGFWHLLLKWKGSVIKLVWSQLLIFLLAFFTFSFIYRFVLVDRGLEQERELFEMYCIYCQRFIELIPIQFLTGFYVSQVVTRWWDMFMSLPFPDKVALKLTAYIAGKDHFKKNLRRTVMRYTNLSTVLVYRLVSKKVMKRFPDMQSLVDSKLILPHEADRLEKVDMRSRHESTWTPILWALKLVQRARARGKIEIEAPVYANLVSSFDYIETCNRKILNYGWVEFPLAYTQVVTIAVYVYFAAALFGRQFLIPRGEHLDNSTFPSLAVSFSTSEPYDTHTPDIYFPLFTCIQFACYMGWIKVAEQLLNPFGDDDEDFEMNYLIDRNLQVSYLIVDEADTEMELAQDPFLEAGISIPEDLPYQDDSDQLHRSNSKMSRGLSKRHKKTSVSLVSLNKINSDGTFASPGGGRKISTALPSPAGGGRKISTNLHPLNGRIRTLSTSTIDGNSPNLKRRDSTLFKSTDLLDVEEGVEEVYNDGENNEGDDDKEENTGIKQLKLLNEKLKKISIQKDQPIFQGIDNYGYLTDDLGKTL